MAKIVLGMCLSHTPQLHTAPKDWDIRVAADKAQKAHIFRGRTYDWSALVAARAGENLAPEATVATRRQRLEASHAALDRLVAVYREVAPDVAVIVGNDQHELFQDDVMPAFTVYWGETIENLPRSEAEKVRLPAGISLADHGHAPPEKLIHPGLPELGERIIRQAIADDFDVAHSRRLHKVDRSLSILSGIPHAYGFVYRQIMKDDVIPNVPVILNTFYPPNQPSVRRCFAFGRSIARAIESWDSGLRVAVFGSGGLSHFVVDADFDRRFLAALARNDVDALAAEREATYRSGTSECKNWITAAGILSATDLRMNPVDYQPLYRSEGGTGTGTAYAYWM